ncbi:hypothetical protein GCK32_003784 [Trichostrongylus colubriformis]|uniref:Diphthine--ammonia ligase n=1 Tax=Trichostrongylus colubriformis TaxID=6319 RepID=A0AAN8GDL6_TRICO
MTHLHRFTSTHRSIARSRSDFSIGMACGLALKRPHEYDSYLADESFPHEAKRARHTAAHCSPFRPQMGTIAANLPSTSSFAQAVSKDDSPFAAVAGKCQLSESQLDAYLRSEVRNGQRRKLLPRRNCSDVKLEDENTPRNDYRIPNSPPQSNMNSTSSSQVNKWRHSSKRIPQENFHIFHNVLAQVVLIIRNMYVSIEGELGQRTSRDRSTIPLRMDVVGLVSGGKDSCYNMMCATEAGNRIVALANLHSGDRGELDSYMYQSVGSEGVAMIADAMGLPMYRREIKGSPLNQDYDYTVGVSAGAILSSYQKLRVEDVCRRLDLVPLCYLWERDQKELLRDMLRSGLNAILIKVAAVGLNKGHLGKTLSEASHGIRPRSTPSPVWRSPVRRRWRI